MGQFKFESINSLADTGFAGTYTTLVAAIPSEAVRLIITTTLDQSCMLSLDGGVTDHIAVPKTSDANSPIIVDLVKDELEGYSYHAGSAIKVKDIGTSTTGSIYISILSRA